MCSDLSPPSMRPRPAHVRQDRLPFQVDGHVAMWHGTAVIKPPHLNGICARTPPQARALGCGPGYWGVGLGAVQVHIGRFLEGGGRSKGDSLDESGE